MPEFIMFVYTFIFAMVLNLIYTVAYVKFVDYRKLKIYQARVREWMARRKKAILTGDPKLIRAIAKETEIIKRMQAEIATETMKPFFATFFVFLLFLFLAKNLLNSTVLEFPFPIWFGGIRELNGFWAIVLIGFFLNGIIRPIMKYYDIMT